MKKAISRVMTFALTVVCAAAAIACNDNKAPAADNTIPATSWNQTVETFFDDAALTEGNGAEAIEEKTLLSEHFVDFHYEDGKYTASEIVSTDVVIEDVVITVSQGKIIKITYKLRYSDPNKADKTVTIENGTVTYGELAKPVAPAATLTEWQEYVTAFGEITNFTQVSRNENVLDLYRVDGTTDYREVVGTYYLGEINGKNGTEYFRYSRKSALDPWQKSVVGEPDYGEDFEYNSIVAYAAEALTANYEAFEYSAGTYTADHIVYDEMDIENLEVVVSGGRIVSVKFTEYFFGDTVIDNIGTTTVALPDNIATVAGKTFAFDDIAFEDVPENMQPAMLANAEGTSITFGNGTIDMVSADDSQTGTFSENAGVITATFPEMPGNAQMHFTYNGHELIQVITIYPAVGDPSAPEGPQIVYIIYKETV